MKSYRLPLVCLMLSIIVCGCQPQTSPKIPDITVLYAARHGVLDTLTARAGDGEVTLTWTKSNSIGVTGYLLYRWEEGKFASPMRIYKELPADTQNFSDTGLANGIRYFYALFAKGKAGRLSDPVQAWAIPGASPEIATSSPSGEYLTNQQPIPEGQPGSEYDRDALFDLYALWINFDTREKRTVRSTDDGTPLEPLVGNWVGPFEVYNQRWLMAWTALYYNDDTGEGTWVPSTESGIPRDPLEGNWSGPIIVREVYTRL